MRVVWTLACLPPPPTHVTASWLSSAATMPQGTALCLCQCYSGSAVSVALPLFSMAAWQEIIDNLLLYNRCHGTNITIVMIEAPATLSCLVAFF